jgi:hypothetical protein
VDEDYRQAFAAADNTAGAGAGAGVGAGVGAGAGAVVVVVVGCDCVGMEPEAAGQKGLVVAVLAG